MSRAVCAVAICTSLAYGCGSDNPNAPSSTPPPATTRIIGISGNLSFGDVNVGGSRDMTLTISNTGNATLTVTGLSVTGGMASFLTASWLSGTIAAGGSQTVTIRFEPTTAATYSGTLTVNGDQTSGTNTIAISGSASFAFGGTWSGQYIIERCDGTGSLQDLLCSAQRGIYPVGTSLPIRIVLTQSGSTVSGTVSFGAVTGPVNGTVTGDGLLTLAGTATSSTLTLQISGWSTRVQGNSMIGNIAYNASISGVPGVGVVTSRLDRVTR